MQRSLKEEWKAFLIDRGFCPVCESDKNVFPRGTELVCVKCGLVLGPAWQPSSKVPGVGNNTNFAPENHLCFGKLGNVGLSNGRWNIHRIISKNGKENLGIRAIRVRNQCNLTEESTVTRRMKNYLSSWSKQFGWSDNEQGNNAVFSNKLGLNVEWIGGLLTVIHDGRNTKDLSRGIFVLNVRRFFGEKKALEVAEALKCRLEYVEKADYLIKLRLVIKDFCRRRKGQRPGFGKGEAA